MEPSDEIREHIKIAIKKTAVRSVVGMAQSAAATSFSGFGALIDGRRVLITAAHCLEGMDRSSSVLAFSLGHPVCKKPWRVVWAGVDKDNDVGAFVLHHDDAHALGLDWIPQEQLTSRDVRSDAIIAILGVPRVLGIQHSANPVITEMRPAMYLTHLSSRSPTEQDATLDRPYDPDFDLWAEMPLNNIHWPMGEPEMTGPFGPEGLSGAGLFAFDQIRTGELWAPLPRLIGIQTGFRRQDGLLRGSRSEAAIRLAGTCPRSDGSHG